MEIVDSRFADWRIKLADTVADLACNGAVAVASSRVVPLDGLRLPPVGMTLTRNGELVDTGAGAAALGDPLAVVAWLANTLGAVGVAPRARPPVMTGALHAAVPDGAGRRLPRRVRPARPDHRARRGGNDHTADEFARGSRRRVADRTAIDADLRRVPDLDPPGTPCSG